MEANTAEVVKAAALSEENHKRLANVDTSLRFICGLFDKLFDDASLVTSVEDCCHEPYNRINLLTGEQGSIGVFSPYEGKFIETSGIGTGMICVARQLAEALGYGNEGKGVCATSCGGVLPH